MDWNEVTAVDVLQAVASGFVLWCGLVVLMCF
jgi:hypothetical protein